MTVRIKQLNCRVTARTGSKKPIAHRNEKAAKPSMQFAMPQPQARSEAPLEPSATVTEQTGAASGGRPKPSLKQADARAVSDRVMELMKQEIRQARERGAGR